MPSLFSANLGSGSASQLSFSPAGLLVSTDVQSAINEAARYADANPLNYSWVFDDFTWGNESQTPSGAFGLVPTGNAGGGQTTPGNFAGSLAGRWGVIGFGTGTTVNNTANGCVFSDYAVCYAGQNLSTSLYFGVYTPATIFDATNDWILDLGFRNSINNGNANNSMSIQAIRATSTQWMGYSSNNGSGTQVTTASASLLITAGAYWNFKITIASGSVHFFAAAAGGNYLEIGTGTTTNLPDSTHSSYMCFMNYKGATMSSQRVMGIDYVGVLNSFSSQR